ncbi:MAG TPA: DCC1-like thiol-disulfide oxidoreductase family protein [Tepidisphaeraceae bacterium]|jgi:predicted DCC family thiol-disulfide oxidoreductase YuxK|nr:DCC1-like thiol-disulfide oxidoreductase family protein [Tepidisphaeraceae bacterium]
MLDQPVLIYDGNCSFCRRWIERWRCWTKGRIAYRPYQSAAADFPQVPREEFGRAVYLFEPDGRTSRAAEAVLRSLYLAGTMRWIYWAYQHVPGVELVMEAGYRFVARNRSML